MCIRDSVYTATKKPGKAKVTFKAAKKSAKLSFKKLSNAKGYEIKYANNSKMKKAKTKTTTKSSIAKMCIRDRLLSAFPLFVVSLIIPEFAPFSVVTFSVVVAFSSLFVLPHAAKHNADTNNVMANK